MSNSAIDLFIYFVTFFLLLKVKLDLHTEALGIQFIITVIVIMSKLSLYDKCTTTSTGATSANTLINKFLFMLKSPKCFFENRVKASFSTLGDLCCT